jgi:hypothetical protein
VNRSRTHIKFILISVAVLLTPLLVRAQEKVEVEKLRPKRVIDKVEVFAGPNLIMSNADEWTNFFNQAIGTTYEIQKKYGYLVGLGVAHSFTSKFELQGRLSWEASGFKEKYTTVSGSVTNESFNNDNNAYLTLAFTGHLKIGTKNSWHLFSGPYLSRILSSEEFSTQYKNGLLTGSARINTIDGMNQYTYGIWLGTGYAFNWNSGRQIEIRLQGSCAMNDVISVNKYSVRCNSIALLIAFIINRRN